MNIRVSYMRTPTDGFCVAESFDVLNLPRIGDNVFLPETLLDVFRAVSYTHLTLPTILLV